MNVWNVIFWTRLRMARQPEMKAKSAAAAGALNDIVYHALIISGPNSRIVLTLEERTAAIFKDDELAQKF